VKDDEAVLARGVFLAVLKAIVNGQLVALCKSS
jgi:hypothetical protein